MKIEAIYNKIHKKIQNALSATPSAEDPVLADAPAVEIDDNSGFVTNIDVDGMDIDTEAEIVAEPAHVGAIFDRVIEIFNASLPDFLKASMDEDKQRQYLYEALDDSVKHYLSTLDDMAQRRSSEQWKAERETQRRELEKLRERARELDKKKNEYTELRLSSERQRRALNDRVQDLETRLNEAMAEKDRLEAENRSLVNKAKIAGVFESDVEAMRKEIEELKRNRIPRETMQELEQLNKRVEELETENAKLNEACDTAKKKDEIGEAMINDMQKQSAEATKNLKEAESTIEGLNQEIKNRDARIDDLRQKINELESQIEDNRSSFDSIKEIASQLDKFEVIKLRLEEKIRQLTEQVKKLESENMTLRETIKKNLYTEAEREKELMDEIHKLYTDKDKEEVPKSKGDSSDDTDDVLLDMSNK